MHKFIAITIMGMISVFCSAGTLTISALPEGDGLAIDKDLDGIADTASATGDKNEAFEVSSGKIWGRNYKAHFEFKLPEGSLKLKCARLEISLNGKFGCHPEKAGAAGPETMLFYYLSPDANGKVELTDDGAGKKIGVFIGGLPVKDTLKPITCDVTAAVREALEAQSVFLGFRLEAAENSATNCCWRWRTAEFANKFGKHHGPKLIIETE